MSDAIAYASPFVPPEWIAAHGLCVERLVPPAADEGVGQGICPFASACAAWATSASGARALVLASTCDQMRRTGERVGRSGSLPVFVMNVPATWQTRAARSLYLAELQRLGRFLVACGGRDPSPECLVETMRGFDSRRRGVRLRPGRCTARQYAEALVQIACDREPNLPGTVESAAVRARVALVGGPLRRDDLWIYDLLEQLGAEVVLDATEAAERSLPAPFDEAAMLANPLAELARAYFDTIPDAFRRPDTLLHEYLGRELRRRGARGVILVRCAWCDHWHAQYGRLKETLGLPLVEIDLGGRDDQLQRTRTRIETLVDIAR